MVTTSVGVGIQAELMVTGQLTTASKPRGLQVGVPAYEVEVDNGAQPPGYGSYLSRASQIPK